MPDIIKLLSDNIANQIAAGEVIQRPASAVKEMLENAVDAGATKIHLLLKDAGKELIQVIDNGKGMSQTDARLCFERHATSKIKSIEDLFAINTMGFRGEALASIAAVGRVEMKTKTPESEVGSSLLIENSTVLEQEICSCPTGTNLAVKNLFFNVPARRNFLKSNTTEMRHVVDEFTRVALAFPNISFRMSHNNSDLFYLESGNLKQRCLALLGNHFQNKLVEVNEENDVFSVKGFCGTPEAASKTRGQQFIFVNNRYIRSHYLNHAISNAYKQLLPSDSHPFFVLFIDINPARVDINVHPTKQEIKFDDDKIIYAFMQSAITHALSKYSISPSLDFQLDVNIENLDALKIPMNADVKQATKENFLFQSFSRSGQAHFLEKTNASQNWKSLYDIQQEIMPESVEKPALLPLQELLKNDYKNCIQLHNSFILTYVNGKTYIINQTLAHQRILYEQYLQAEKNPISIQQSAVPQHWEVNTSDAILINSLLDDFKNLGYQIEPFGKNTFIIQGIPSSLKTGNEIQSLEKIIEAYKHESTKMSLDKKEQLYRTMAYQNAVKANAVLSFDEMQQLVEQLFSCKIPVLSPANKKVFVQMNQQEIEKLFRNE